MLNDFTRFTGTYSITSDEDATGGIRVESDQISDGPLLGLSEALKKDTFSEICENKLNQNIADLQERLNFGLPSGIGTQILVLRAGCGRRSLRVWRIFLGRISNKRS